MVFFKVMTQGGQVHIHQLRMLKQVLCAGVIASLIIGGGYFTWKCMNVPGYAWRATYETYWAKMMFATNPASNHKQLTQIYTPVKGEPYQRDCANILTDPVLQKTTHNIERYVILIGHKSLWIMFWSFPGDYPCTKLRMRYQRPSNKQSPFLLKPEKENPQVHSPLSIPMDQPQKKMQQIKRQKEID